MEELGEAEELEEFLEIRKDEIVGHDLGDDHARQKLASHLAVFEGHRRLFVFFLAVWKHNKRSEHKR